MSGSSDRLGAGCGQMTARSAAPEQRLCHLHADVSRPPRRRRPSARARRCPAQLVPSASVCTPYTPAGRCRGAAAGRGRAGRDHELVVPLEPRPALPTARRGRSPDRLASVSIATTSWRMRTSSPSAGAPPASARRVPRRHARDRRRGTGCRTPSMRCAAPFEHDDLEVVDGTAPARAGRGAHPAASPPMTTSRSESRRAPGSRGFTRRGSPRAGPPRPRRPRRSGARCRRRAAARGSHRHPGPPGSTRGRLTDGRFSGGTTGLCVGHVAPGGRRRRADRVRPRRRPDPPGRGRAPPGPAGRRGRAGHPPWRLGRPEPKHSRGVLAKYARLVGSARYGAVCD